VVSPSAAPIPLTCEASGDTARGVAEPGLPQTAFDDLYSAVYDILDDAKTSHSLVKLYKGSHAAAQPHPSVLDFGTYFLARRQGLLGYACQGVSSGRPPALADLDRFDRAHAPRVSTTAAFGLLSAGLRRDGESDQDLLTYLTSRTHPLGAYRGGSSGMDEETRAFAAAHFRTTGITVTPEEIVVFCGGAKGAFLAFCAALMLRREHDDLHHLGGLMLAPAGYYQSLRLIPAIFGGDIHVMPELTSEVVRRWLHDTAPVPRRCIYVPLVNNADGHVLTRPEAYSLAHAVLEHNAAHPGSPVFVLADDVYAGSYLAPGCTGTPIASVTGDDLGEPQLGPMSYWSLTVATASKTFALPTARVAFTATTNRWLRRAVAHYRTVFSQGRVPQVTELMAIAAMCLTPQAWIDGWNAEYRARLTSLTSRIEAINTDVGFPAIRADPPQGGWYVPLRIASRLIPGAASSVDAFTALMHYGEARRNTGVALLPGDLFGCRDHGKGFLLRATLAPAEPELREFTSRLREAAGVLTGPDGQRVVKQALRRARAVADVDAILSRCRY
jgi:aspartate/methionine/tyrosine aminotransferase